MIKEANFSPYTEPRDRTFNMYDKTEDAANGTHDYLKYLKFGYGRATDDASTEIRHGRMTREEGIEMVKKYDHVRPRDLDFFLDTLQITEDQFVGYVDSMRDTNIWTKDTKGKWTVKDSVANHAKEPGVDEARVSQSKDRTTYLAPNPDTDKKYHNDFIIL